MIVRNQTLGHVLDELERYRPGRIWVMEEALRDLPISGSFSISDTDMVLDNIEQILPVIFHRPTGFLVIAAADD